MSDAVNKVAGGVEVIVTTYNNPTALHYTLLGLQDLQGCENCASRSRNSFCVDRQRYQSPAVPK